MKKVNKALMATVAILLSLVLISTSVLSGVFAKFVDTKSAGATVSLKAFGVTLTMSIPDATVTALENAGASIPKDTNGKPLETFTSEGNSITISGLKMLPGMTFPKAVKFEFGGAPTVPVQVKITPTITYDSKVHTTTEAKDSAGNVTATYYNYYVPANTIVQSIANDGTITYMPATYFMPLGFTFSKESTSTTDTNVVTAGPWFSSTTKANVDDTVISNAIASGIAPGNNTHLKGSSAEPPKGQDEISVSGNTITIGTFAAGRAISFDINTATGSTFFHMGFYYPLDSSTDKEKYDKISTYIAEHLDPNCTVTISYKVEIVQVQATT